MKSTHTSVSVHFVKRSSNGKIGPIPCTVTSEASCPSNCPLKGEGCYAETGPVSWNWSQVSAGLRGGPWADLLASVEGIAAGKLWRHNVAGDLPHRDQVIERDALAQLVAANGSSRGFTYTHHKVTGQGAAALSNRAAVRHANANGLTINLSANSIGEIDALAALDIGPVVCLLPADHARKTRRVGKDMVWAESLTACRDRRTVTASPGGLSIVQCPATFLDVNCKDCKLCAVASRKTVIGFPAHGSRKAAAEATL